MQHVYVYGKEHKNTFFFLFFLTRREQTIDYTGAEARGLLSSQK